MSVKATPAQVKARIKYIQLQKDWAKIKVCQKYGYKMPKRLQKGIISSPEALQGRWIPS